ncbi:MAG TPA: CHASE domain-containing protein [Gallionellaceae bacterium]|nr:CHASE domain-containing protein [Gallionellaceae bacterium]
MQPISSITPKWSVLFRATPWLILCLCLAATYILWNNAQNHAQARQKEEFDFRVNDVTADIKNRIEGYELILRGSKALFNASREVSRQDFHNYISALNLRQDYPGIQGIGFSRWLSAQAKTHRLAQVRAASFHDYSSHPLGGRDAYSTIIFIEPFDWRNQRAFGYDMYAEPLRRAAMALARDENRAAISRKVRLLQETEGENQAGFLMYLPVYRHDVPHDTLAQRRANLLGWVYAPFRMNDLMNGILERHFGEINETLDLEIYDGDMSIPENLMYVADQAHGGHAVLHQSRFEHAENLELGGHQWTIYMRSRPGFESRLKNERTQTIIIAGTGISLLLTWIVWLLVNGRRRVLQLAEKMNLELIETSRQLRENERYQHALLADLPAAVVVHGPDGAIRYSNAAAQHILGLTEAEAMGRMAQSSEWRFLHEDGSPLPAETYPVNQVFADKKPLHAYLMGIDRGAISGKSWTLVNAYPELDNTGQVTQVVVYFLDVTQHKQAENQLKNLNRFYSVLTRANEAIVRATCQSQLFEDICRIAVEDGQFVMAWVGLIDNDLSEIIPVAHWGNDAGYLECLRKVGILSFNGPTAQTLHTGDYHLSQDIAADAAMNPWRRKAVQRGYGSSAAFPIHLGHKVVGAINLYAAQAHYFNAEIIHLLHDLAQDISFALGAFDQQDRRAFAETQLQQLNQELEQRVAERTRQLENANKELESFSYSVSHDLRAPLRSIDGFSDILQKTYADSLDDKGRDYLGRVRRASKRMGELIDDLLQLSRVTLAELRKEKVNLSAMVQGISAEIQETAPQRQATWIIQDDIVVQADSRLMKAVLENLLGNAWKFTANQPASRIEFGLIAQGNEKVIFVRDNGAGFDMQYAGKLFGAFQRLHNIEEFDGTGIGLATVQRIIHRHGGRVWAEGQTGHGATIYFTL